MTRPEPKTRPPRSCKDCARRQPGCHDSCPDYKAARDFAAAEKRYNKAQCSRLTSSSGNTSADWTRNIRKKNRSSGRYRMHKGD